MKKKTKVIIKDIAKGLFHTFIVLSIISTFSGFFIVFLDANIEYFQELPDLLKLMIPFGFMAINFKILCINWFPVFKKQKEAMGE